MYTVVAAESKDTLEPTIVVESSSTSSTSMYIIVVVESKVTHDHTIHTVVVEFINTIVVVDQGPGPGGAG